jgi:hypothetical protein
MKTYQYVLDRLDKIKKLEGLKNKIDPASGMSVCVKRGVLSDANEEENDRPLREWISIEICENMEEIIDLLLVTQVNSLKLWLNSARQEEKEASLAIKSGEEFIKNYL